MTDDDEEEAVVVRLNALQGARIAKVIEQVLRDPDIGLSPEQQELALRTAGKRLREVLGPY